MATFELSHTALGLGTFWHQYRLRSDRQPGSFTREPRAQTKMCTGVTKRLADIDVPSYNHGARHVQRGCVHINIRLVLLPGDNDVTNTRNHA